MSRALHVAGALGATALIGAGVMPFLHREETPEIWFELRWPGDVDEGVVVELLRHLAASRRPQVVTFEIRAERGRLTQLVGCGRSEVERLRHLFRTYLPDVLFDPAKRPSGALQHAVALRLGSRERALRMDAATEISRSIVSALAGTSGVTVMQWQLGARLVPSRVPQDSRGLPSAARALSQAAAHGLAPLDAKERHELQAKIGERGFAAVLRIGTSNRDRRTARGILRAVVSGIRVAESPGVPLRVRGTAPGPVATAQPPRRFPVAINVLELVGLLGWPLGCGDYPGVTRLTSRRLPVPGALPRQGRIIGDGNHPMTARPVAFTMHDALMHTHVLGPTGVGKSTLLAHLAIQDIEAGRAVVVIEPKGDLVDDILARIPADREPDVVVLDPTDDQAPVGLNPLAHGSPELAADQVLAVFRGLYRDYLGPRTTDVLHAALLTLARADHATLVALPLLLTDDQLRRRLTATVHGDLALGPFWAWYEGLSEGERQQVIGPVMNKVRPFLLRERVRHVLGQGEPRFDIGRVFTERKVLLAPLGKGALGSEAAGLVGSLVVSQLWQAAQARASLAPERRHAVSVIIDEFQDFLHLPTDLGDVLAQARGLGLGLTLAHQHLAQLSPDVRAAVLANARSRVCFRLSPDDATVIARAADRLDAKDFQHLGRYEIYASLVADGAVEPFCSATTRPLDAAMGNATRVRQSSRETFGVPRQAIEAELRTVWTGQIETDDGSIGSRRRRDQDRGDQP